ncbi:hypothetical protein AOLI_G00237380 [Acnodon oligacanthus]
MKTMAGDVIEKLMKTLKAAPRGRRATPITSPPDGRSAAGPIHLSAGGGTRRSPAPSALRFHSAFSPRRGSCSLTDSASVKDVFSLILQQRKAPAEGD